MAKQLPYVQAVQEYSGFSVQIRIHLITCSPRKNPYPCHERSLETPRGRGVLKVKSLEAMYENKLEFPGGRVGAKQKPSVAGGGGYGYFLKLHSTVKALLAPRRLIRERALIETGWGGGGGGAYLASLQLV